MKVGDKIRVIRMNGVVGVISHIDSMGQIHLEGYGLAIIPEVDEFEVIQ
jgi:hypothetical protein